MQLVIGNTPSVIYALTKLIFTQN